jgi:hypothetical protein
VSDAVPVTREIVDLFEEYDTARSAVSRWQAHERALKQQILEALGYAEGDQRPAPVTATTPTGRPLFEVRVSYRKGLDLRHLQDRHPEAYAACEKTSPVRTIKRLEV